MRRPGPRTIDPPPATLLPFAHTQAELGPAYRETVNRYYAASGEVSADVFAALGALLGEGPGFFAARSTELARSTLRLLRYGGGERSGEHERGISMHTDFEAFTLIHESAPGLEIVRPGRSTSEVVNAGRGTLTCIVGDVVERLSNGEYPATPHLVRRNSWERYSVARFNGLDGDAVVAPLPRFVDEGRPALYAAISQGEHLDAEVAAATDNLDGGRDDGSKGG